MRLHAPLSIYASLSVLIACSDNDTPKPETKPVIEGVSNATIEKLVDTLPDSAVGPVDTVNGERQLQFTQPNFSQLLASVGLRPVDLGTVRYPFIGPEGRRYAVPGGEVLAFIYGDAVALARDIDKLDTTTVAPRGVKPNWPAPASLQFTNNLAVIILTKDSGLRDKIRQAIKSY
jgi:hypothetical protein